MTDQQKLKLLRLITDIPSDEVVAMAVTPHPETNGEQRYEARIEGLTSTGDWGLMIEEVI